MIFSIGKKAEVKNIKLTNAKTDNTKKLVSDLLKSRNINEDRLEVFEKDEQEREEELEEIQKGLMSPKREIEEEDED